MCVCMCKSIPCNKVHSLATNTALPRTAQAKSCPLYDRENRHSPAQPRRDQASRVVPQQPSQPGVPTHHHTHVHHGCLLLLQQLTHTHRLRPNCHHTHMPRPASPTASLANGRVVVCAPANYITGILSHTTTQPQVRASGCDAVRTRLAQSDTEHTDRGSAKRITGQKSTKHLPPGKVHASGEFVSSVVHICLYCPVAKYGQTGACKITRMDGTKQAITVMRLRICTHHLQHSEEPGRTRACTVSHPQRNV